MKYILHFTALATLHALYTKVFPMADLEELFIKTQISEIIIHQGKLGSATTVWKWFRNHNPNIPKSRIPTVRTFSRLIQRFTDTISTENGKTSGCKAETMTKENLETICLMIV